MIVTTDMGWRAELGHTNPHYSCDDISGKETPPTSTKAENIQSIIIKTSMMILFLSLERTATKPHTKL